MYQATCSRERATNGVKIRLRQRREAVRDGGTSLQQSSRGCKHSHKVRKAAESEAYLGQVVTGSLLHVQNEVARNRPDRTHGATKTQQNARRNKQKSVTMRPHQRRSSRQPATHAQGEERNRSTSAERATHGTAPPVELDSTRKDAAVGAFTCRALRKDASEALCKAACNDTRHNMKRNKTNESPIQAHACLQLPLNSIGDLVEATRTSGEDLVTRSVPAMT